uniref:Sugar phosphate transporter domain-containing protein n=1 Tax=Tetradesmus obliquus TaxID=3088 RepID=A0A383WD92_TETOB|eukprot:jgi/Sobl393_1/12593/SZX75220.1
MMKVLDVPDTIKQHGSRTLNLQLAAIGVLFGSALVLGNASFIFLSVPTVQMLKAGGPATIYVLGIALGTESAQLLQALRVLVVCFGVGIASYGDVTLNLAGLVLQLGSIVTDALRCCFLQRVLQHSQVDTTPLVTLAHVAPYSAAALVLPMAVVEGRRLVQTFDDWQPAIPAVLLSGLLAACLNFVVFKLIQLTSALTTSLSGVIKEWVCILVAMYVYGTVVTYMQWVGYSIAIAGLLWYQSGKLAAAAAAAGAKSADAAAGSCSEEKARLISSSGGSTSEGGSVSGSGSSSELKDIECGGKGS